MARVSVTVREGPKFTRHRFDTLAAGLELARNETERMSHEAHGKPAQALMRKLEPVEQVVGRVELTVSQRRFGKSHRAGLDVRGDGSIEAYAGGISREVIEPVPGEDVYDALRRAIESAN